MLVASFKSMLVCGILWGLCDSLLKTCRYSHISIRPSERLWTPFFVTRNTSSTPSSFPIQMPDLKQPTSSSKISKPIPLDLGTWTILKNEFSSFWTSQKRRLRGPLLIVTISHPLQLTRALYNSSFKSNKAFMDSLGVKLVRSNCFNFLINSS